jgi:hypothetical protein
MISSEVERTLVKSPPELWTELSDPAALARHLGEFGEIRITRVEPERRVDWEADNATGTVMIKASGWGTKVTLSVTKDASEPEAQQSSEPQPAGDAQPEPEPEAQQSPEPQPAPDAQPEPEAQQAPEPQPAPEPELETRHEPPPDAEPAPALEPELEPRRGFFARLFGLRRREPTDELAPAAHTARSEDAPGQPTSAFAAVSRVLAPETFAGGRTTVTPWPEPEPEAAAVADTGADAPAPPDAHLPAEDPAATDAGTATAEPGIPSDSPAPPTAEAPATHAGTAPTTETADISAEIAAAEEVAAEKVTAALTAVLDRLGAAHHRPFSRS